MEHIYNILIKTASQVPSEAECVAEVELIPRQPEPFSTNPNFKALKNVKEDAEKWLTVHRIGWNAQQNLKLIAQKITKLLMQKPMGLSRGEHKWLVAEMERIVTNNPQYRLSMPGVPPYPKLAKPPDMLR